MMKFVTPIVLSLLVVGCSSIPTPKKRIDNANTVAISGDLKPVMLKVDGFDIKSYQKLSKEVTDKELSDKASPTANTPHIVRLYIEGDGFTNLNRAQPSTNPTPVRPVALELASVDDASDVIYLARLCQYMKNPQYKCGKKYWTTHRYSGNVYNLYMRILNQLKVNYNIDQFELVGFSGGGTLATLLAHTRTDIKSLRTVAGNLDTLMFTRIHNMEPLKHSLNPLTYAERGNRIPQMHFIGETDHTIPPNVAHSYLLKQTGSNNRAKARMHIVTGTGHDTNWQDKWPELLKYPLQ